MMEGTEATRIAQNECNGRCRPLEARGEKKHLDVSMWVDFSRGQIPNFDGF